VVGIVFAGTWFVFNTEITELASVSFAVTTALMLGCAVNCCWKFVSACWLSQVPPGSPTFT
jgi:hypothetical protein